MKRHAISILCALLVLAALSLGGSAARAQTLTCIVPDGQYVNVRNQAFSSAAAWGILHSGDTIETDPSQITNGFFKTTFNDRVAYVSVKYFEIPVERDYIVEANGRVRMRKTPGGSADGFIKPGQRVHVLSWRYAADGSMWAKCTGGKYISADYLTVAEN